MVGRTQAAHNCQDSIQSRLQFRSEVSEVSAQQLGPIEEYDDEEEEEDPADEEMVEMPQRALPAKPGVPLFGPLHQRKEAFRDLGEEITNILKIQHAEVMQRLDQQDRTLRELRDVNGAGIRHRPSVKSGRGSINKDKKSVHLDIPKVKQKSTFTPKLFSSLTAVDLKLKAGAADVDAEATKAKKDAMVTDRTQSINQPRSWLHQTVHSPFFDLCFATAILVNTVFIGAEVELSQPGVVEHLWIQVTRYFFSGLFTLELFMRLAADGCCGFFCAEDSRWNMLDIFIVLSSWWEIGLELLYITSTDSAGGMDNVVGLTGLRALRILRITRLVKLARVARILRFVMALRTLTQSIIYTLKSLIWAIFLLFLIVYIFGILFLQALKDYESDPHVSLTDEELAAKDLYFRSLWISMLSLFMSIAGGVSWGQLLLPLHAISTVWIWVFLCYISFTYFAVLNVVTGVFCQSAIDSAQSDHDAVLQSILANKQAHIEKIRYLFNEIDAEEVGVITYQMFQDKVGTKEVQTYFESIDLDIWDAWSFFKLLDLDSGGAIEVEEFLMGCLRLRGNARAMDMAKLCHDQAWLIRNQSRFWNFVEEELIRTRQRLDQLTEQQAN
ncbi:Voltage-dependent T-type calcium channel subunit alpha-1H (Voltage-gated calcium channel subunit alpha Cav3.2) [Durusdinium trenchii]|uniref:Voltage-dependent T-type calcium channel subunit alpha-1H (Voltage-gated calcium channel subunit alpha Cav3.2) n=1 Tax=Durusdinium trenchii TaxID=1381693 RepID=A0ABP0L8T6_9DINO